MNSLSIAFSLLLFFSAAYAHLACLTTPILDFWSDRQHADCDYERPNTNFGSRAEHAIDVYWLTRVHEYAVANSPSAPFGGALVDTRTNTLVAIASNQRGNSNPYWSNAPVSHAETLLLVNASITVLPDIVNATTGRRSPNPNWRYMTMYASLESCPQCAMAAVWSGVRSYAYGARASELQKQRCWSQPTLTSDEVIDHSKGFAPFNFVRGPMPELESTILQAFANHC